MILLENFQELNWTEQAQVERIHKELQNMQSPILQRLVMWGFAPADHELTLAEFLKVMEKTKQRTRQRFTDEVLEKYLEELKLPTAVGPDEDDATVSWGSVVGYFHRTFPIAPSEASQVCFPLFRTTRLRKIVMPFHLGKLLRSLVLHMHYNTQAKSSLLAGW